MWKYLRKSCYYLLEMRFNQNLAICVCVCWGGGGGVPKELRTSQRKKLLNFGEIRDLIDLKFNFFHAMTNSGSNKHE